MRVLGARCIVREDQLSDKTKSGITIPGMEKQHTNKGTVMVVGNGAMLDNGTVVPMIVKAGDTVIYASFSGSPIEAGGENFLVLNERDILCILDPGEDTKSGEC